MRSVIAFVLLAGAAGCTEPTSSTPVTGIVYGTVTSSQGEAVADADVIVTALYGWGGASTATAADRTDEVGNYRVELAALVTSSDTATLRVTVAPPSASPLNAGI